MVLLCALISTGCSGQVCLTSCGGPGPGPGVSGSPASPRESVPASNGQSQVRRRAAEGFDRVPDVPSLLGGVHSGGALTMDAWTLLDAWNRHF